MKVSYSDQQMIQRYVSKNLRDDELAHFECWLLDHPDMVVEVETQLALRDGIRLGAAFDLSSRQSSTPAALPIYKRGWFATAAAAVLIAVLTPSFLMIQQQTTSEYLYGQLQTMQQPRGNITLLQIEQTRSSNRTLSGNDFDGMIYLGDEPKTVVVQILAPENYNFYHEFAAVVTINDQTLTDIHLSKNPDDRHFIFDIPAAYIEEGVAMVKVMGRKGKIEKQLTPEIRIGIDRY